MPEGVQFDLELADLWEWLVGGEEKEGYLPNSISPPMLVGIQYCRCQYLLGILEDHPGPAWRVLNTVKCHLSGNSLSYTTLEGHPDVQIRNCTYPNNHQAKYAKTGTNRQPSCHICSDIITSEFDSQLVLKQRGQKKDKNQSPS